MCAGLIGYRAYAMVRDAKRVGIYGFGAAAHIIAQVAVLEGKEVYAFTRPGDVATQEFAKRLGATWAGASDQASPELLDAAIIFASVGALVPIALANVRKGCTVVCAGIHMSEIPAFSYDLLWGERTLRSVANLTRKDGEEFLRLADKLPIKAHVTTFKLAEANRAIAKLRGREIQGAAVLVVD
jgi:propanol-preferring alcohol dehydrogenase